MRRFCLIHVTLMPERDPIAAMVMENNSVSDCPSTAMHRIPLTQSVMKTIIYTVNAGNPSACRGSSSAI
jgi:hypothetical protein